MRNSANQRTYGWHGQTCLPVFLLACALLATTATANTPKVLKELIEESVETIFRKAGTEELEQLTAAGEIGRAHV